MADGAKTRIYISLVVYNYDASPRHQRIQHACRTVGEASHLVHRLETLNSDKGIPCYGHLGRTGGWLERNHGIYGFVDKIEGIYEETTVPVKQANSRIKQTSVAG